MKKNSLLSALFLLCVSMTAPAQPSAAVSKSRIVEDGGTGPYKAVMQEESSVAAHTVFVPQDLSPFGHDHPLPVLIWGNGACSNSPWEHYKFLNEIASHGFIVVATGYIPMDDTPYQGPMSTAQQQIEGIDWVMAQNQDPQSAYYQKLDTRNICVAGMSCGGLQSLFNCADPRITALMICNSGLFNQQNAHTAVGGMPMPPKEKLEELHTPVLYILGGKEDIAYENGMDDFRRITHVPAIAVNYPVGHGGTYREAHGGEFTVPALAWLQWQLKGDRRAADMFLSLDSGLSSRPRWTVEKNGLAGGSGDGFSKVNMPLFQTKYTADPSPLVVGDTLFLYTSHDASPEDIPDQNERSSAGFFMYDWLLWSTTDMVNWTEHGAVASLNDFAWRSRENGAWAIQTVVRNGKYYLYAPLHGHGIGVLVSDSPYGPFRDPLGKPLVWQREHWEDIDPTVFIDDDGQAYMYWGNPNTYWVKLNEDMISTEGEIHKLLYPIEHYQEGPWLYKRGAHYYLAYATTCCPEALGYAMSHSPEGPWQPKGYIMRPTPRDRGNHPGICDYKGRSYLFGQDYDLMHLDTFEHHERRSVSAAEIRYNADGTIQPVSYWLDQPPLQQLQWLDPYRRVEAETMNWGKGLKTAKTGIPNTGVVADMPASTGRRNMYVYDIGDGEYIRIRGVDFGEPGAVRFSASAASTGHCTLTLRLDSTDGPVVGTVHILSTGSSDNYQTFAADVEGARGVRDLYLCFSDIAGDTHLDYWSFDR